MKKGILLATLAVVLSGCATMEEYKATVIEATAEMECKLQGYDIPFMGCVNRTKDAIKQDLKQAK
jgi:outer membrane lipoprotein-sorting protein